MTGTEGLTAREREMISVAVSMANGCLYCLVAHGAALREQSDDRVEADRITMDHRRADLPPRQRAMLDFAVKLTKDPGACGEADLEALREHGFSDEDVWDIVEVASMYNFTNRLAMATGMLPNREYHGLARRRSGASASDEHASRRHAEAGGDDAEHDGGGHVGQSPPMGPPRSPPGAASRRRRSRTSCRPPGSRR